MINKDKKIVFIHMSKTGGIWSQSVLDKYGFKIIDLKINGGHIPNSLDYEDYFTFGFVRHPIAWYKSLYRFFKTNDWKLKNDADFSDLKCNNINEFIDIIREQNIFNLENIYNEFFVKYPVSYIGKYENLYEDLELCLKVNGINASNLIKDKSRTLINSSKKYDCELSREKLEYIFDSCEEIFNKFNYKKEDTE